MLDIFADRRRYRLNERARAILQHSNRRNANERRRLDLRLLTHKDNNPKKSAALSNYFSGGHCFSTERLGREGLVLVVNLSRVNRSVLKSTFLPTLLRGISHY